MKKKKKPAKEPKEYGTPRYLNRVGNGTLLQYSWLENPYEQRSLVGYSLWDRRVGHN